MSKRLNQLEPTFTAMYNYLHANIHTNSASHILFSDYNCPIKSPEILVTIVAECHP